MKFILSATAAILLSAATVSAHEYTVGALQIDHPRAFETAPSVKVGGGYMAITNTGDTDDTLLEVRTPSVPRVELHLSETDANGVARMTKQDGVPIPAGDTVTLIPGGLHVMFMGLGEDRFELGEKVDATLVFENAGTVDVQFSIEERTSDTHNGMDHSGMKMSD
ncbi:copper chaperone PCu(A)C [Sulfitobacter sp. HNIBRBA2951]|uniref:copper chaperone PCu(A)C n=1 Tax=Sulfitobacter aquimarinus TaxID=3158557 RepID=UPI0032DE89A7